MDISKVTNAEEAKPFIGKRIKLKCSCGMCRNSEGVIESYTINGFASYFVVKLDNGKKLERSYNGFTLLDEAPKDTEEGLVVGKSYKRHQLKRGDRFVHGQGGIVFVVISNDGKTARPFPGAGSPYVCIHENGGNYSWSGMNDNCLYAGRVYLNDDDRIVSEKPEEKPAEKVALKIGVEYRRDELSRGDVFKHSRFPDSYVVVSNDGTTRKGHNRSLGTAKFLCIGTIEELYYTTAHFEKVIFLGVAELDDKDHIKKLPESVVEKVSPVVAKKEPEIDTKHCPYCKCLLGVETHSRFCVNLPKPPGPSAEEMKAIMFRREKRLFFESLTSYPKPKIVKKNINWKVTPDIEG